MAGQARNFVSLWLSDASRWVSSVYSFFTYELRPSPENVEIEEKRRLSFIIEHGCTSFTSLCNFFVFCTP